MANASPIVEAFDQVLFVNAFTAASNLFSVTDAENDTITRYRFFDFSNNPNSGLFELNGTAKNNGSSFEINAGQLSSLFYLAGSQIFSEYIEVSAFDGTDWSAPARLRAYTVRENLTKPVVTGFNTTVLGNEAIFANSFIAANDPDGHPIQKYFIRDRRIDQSYFSLNGTQMPQGEYFYISAKDFQDLKYNGVFRGTDIVDAWAWDGKDWSFPKSFDVETVFNANRPIGQFHREVVPQREETSFLDVVNWFDVDGNTAKFFRFFDTNPHSHSGYMVKAGIKQDAKKWIQVAANDLDSLVYVGAERAYVETIRFKVYDGRYWSPIESIEFDNIPVPELGGPRNGIGRQLQDLPMNQIFRKIDDGPAHLSYELYDANSDPISGTLTLNGSPLSAGQIHTVTAVQLENNIEFRTGAYDDRSYDEVYGRAWNGTFNSEWVRVKFRGEPEYDQAMFSGTDWLQVYDQVGNSPGFGDTIEITYSFMQQFPNYETGEAEDNPANDPPRPFSQFTADQRVGARRAFRHLESIADVRFVEVPDTGTDPVSGNRGGTIRLGNYRVEFDASTAAAFAFLPSVNPEAGDIWINTFYMSTFGWGKGTSEYTTFLHELGHAMGMLHPFVPTGGGTQKPALPETTDFDLYTVMSYTGSAAGNPWSYQLYDISELQRLYGANTSFASGDDLYDLDGFFEGSGTPFWSIWDTGGDDTISADGSLIDAVVDLRSGGISSIGNRGQNLSIAFEVIIENAIGGRFNDTLTGNEVANRLIGNDGNDTMRGMGGDDFMSGGAGNDTYIFGIADGDDIINEMSGSGRDRLEIQDFPGLNDLTDDLSFRLENNNLVVDLTMDSGRSQGKITIENQRYGRFQVETLAIGGLEIDLVNLTTQATAFDQQFRAVGSPTIFGQLVVPV